MNTDRAQTRLAIFGSCVSRDTVATLDSEAYELQQYVARQSVISIGNAARAHLPAHLDVASPFQRANIEGDAVGDGAMRLDAVANAVDVLLWDLVDERHGIVRFSDGAVLTRSIDLLQHATLSRALEAGEFVAFGSDAHFSLWREAVERFVAHLRGAGLLERTLVVAVPWASRTTTGDAAPYSMGVSASQANERYARYYEHLADLGLPFATAVAPRADPEHRWGAAPFHYERRVYDAVHAAIDAFVAARREAGA